MAGKSEHLEKQLCTAVAKMREDGKTLYWLAKESGLEYKTINRWWNEGRDIKLSTASSMADALGLKLCPASKCKDK